MIDFRQSQLKNTGSLCCSSGSRNNISQHFKQLNNIVIYHIISDYGQGHERFLHVLVIHEMAIYFDIDIKKNNLALTSKVII